MCVMVVNACVMVVVDVCDGGGGMCGGGECICVMVMVDVVGILVYIGVS